MFNVTILKIKDLINYIFIVTIAIVAIVFLFKITDRKNLTKSLSKAIPTVFQTEQEDKKDKNQKNETDYMKEIINTQISSIQEAQKQKEIQEVNETNTTKEQVTQEDNEEIPMTAQTEVVTQNPIQEKFNAQYRKSKNKKWN